jgi:carbonic anhydrase/acetyltransferase-like protein (isoleucine patch superfamily)
MDLSDGEEKIIYMKYGRRHDRPVKPNIVTQPPGPTKEFPHAKIGYDVEIGAHVRIGNGATIHRKATLAPMSRIAPHHEVAPYSVTSCKYQLDKDKVYPLTLYWLVDGRYAWTWGNASGVDDLPSHLSANRYGDLADGPLKQLKMFIDAIQVNDERPRGKKEED